MILQMTYNPHCMVNGAETVGLGQSTIPGSLGIGHRFEQDMKTVHCILCFVTLFKIIMVHFMLRDVKWSAPWGQRVSLPVLSNDTTS